MADTLQQAEAELRAAALAYAEAYSAYSEAFDRNGDMKRYKERGAPPPLHPETRAKCETSNERLVALQRAAKALAAAIAGQTEERAAVSP